MPSDVFLRLFFGGGTIVLALLAILGFALMVASIRERRGPTALFAGATTVCAGVAGIFGLVLYDSVTLW